MILEDLPRISCLSGNKEDHIHRVLTNITIIVVSVKNQFSVSLQFRRVDKENFYMLDETGLERSSSRGPKGFVPGEHGVNLVERQAMLCEEDGPALECVTRWDGKIGVLNHRPRAMKRWPQPWNIAEGQIVGEQEISQDIVPPVSALISPNRSCIEVPR
ncbi:hypothetical protein TNIN_93601 [Trichonephila inaurata madagascariensis]|uniref:Uncharacterized protein n=1 Tax=Trichonephila inaurata madagascariensis TaxID=2747483 RepID=A0A8X7BR90_9ARAC|nr:hypothetical protein TNIN_93601 [Trichonephila inaurata madagascariensis]